MNFTIGSSDAILKQLTDIAVGQRIPTLIYIGCLSIVGVLGNIHVLVLFTITNRKPSTYTVFVKALSVVDLLTCILHMPLEIVDLMTPYTFYNEVGCKLFRYVNTFLLSSSASILVVIALERYRRVCSPFKRQMPVSVSRWLSYVVIFVCLVLTTPMYLLNGHRLKNIEHNGTNVTGYMCYLSDTYYRSTFLYSYVGSLFCCFIISSGILLVTYFSICRVVFMRTSRSSKKVKTDVYTVESSSDNQNPVENETHDIYLNMSESNRKQLKSSTVRTTRTLVFITGIYITVFVPYFILNFVNSFDKKFKGSLSSFELTLYQIGVRLIFINNVANPFVYGFTDKHFRNGLRKYYCHNKK